MRRAQLAVTAVVVLAVTAGTGGWLLTGRDPAPATEHDASRPTVAVEQGTLRQRVQLTGTLGYGTPRTVTGAGDGIVTWLPSAGVTVARGGQLYRVDDAPVALLYGELPLYRELAEPVPPDQPADDAPPPPPAQHQRGNDVDLVARNLAALGFYDGPTRDATYAGALLSAVRAWQSARDEEPTGVLGPGNVLVSTGPVRVDSLTAQVGDPAAAPVLTVTTTAKVLTLDLLETDAQGVAPGRRIRVTLDDGTVVRTEVRHVGAPTPSDDGGPPTVPVVVRPRKSGALTGAAPGPVTALLVTAARHDVRYVPVTALLALAGGGYALERPDGALVPVDIGMVADGEVEVDGIESGASVVVAR
ncbi:peptidoglycan-binding domain-containing protein [Nocardioides nitrophenolicus]|uniref:peptidoglycan-binding domain-containing protein n=1 Tax=Nocardioides nitrophenolicus TaxID=60489 RepID=UPI001959E3CE|nr:peptidoglycan-binding domain-containing protein [Nocardioides nitrophenolicus]MBM7517202.1 peptidoglycan hydrolase-like protein with peptidoglycan-binding domain [Nocardioides nitrophenolicus]